MPAQRTTARILGALLLLQLAGFIVPFVLLLPMTSPDFLTGAAAHASQVKWAVFLLFWNCALTIGISLTAWPILRSYSEPAALLLVGLSIIMFTLQAVDNAHLLSILSLSRQYTEGGRTDMVETMATTVRSTRRWVHYSELLSIDTWLFTLYAVLYRFRLIPSVLAIIGLITVLLHFGGIVLPVFVGYPSVNALGPLMGVSQLALVFWLVTKGFRTRVAGPTPG